MPSNEEQEVGEGSTPNQDTMPTESAEGPADATPKYSRPQRDRRPPARFDGFEL